ncbi:neurofilament heavy polypeptide-like isoform X2 [Triticum urartu]|uniref:neurofilament heavy polypeptide-like isoform X2 n=1 Tax=Triticum urartu TaxID=4572 RepID=UPI0020431B83|nr:neurofilament heavy polypeptide-like isoform X2 [Triticum urartu]
MEESSPIPPSLVLKWVVDRKSLTVDAMMFQAAYAGVIAPMTDKSEWPEVDLGFKVHPPVQTKNVPGRPRKVRIRGWMEPMRRTVKCKRSKGFGHHQKTCKLPFKLDDKEEEEPDDGEQEKPDDVEKQEKPDDGEQQGLDGGEQKASEEVDPAPKEVQPATKRKKVAAKSTTQGASQAKGKKNIVSNSTKTPAEGKKKAAAKSPTKGGKRKPKGTTPTKENGSATIRVTPEVGTKRKLNDLIRE